MAMSILERLVKARLQATGVENLGDGPTLYMINHFTRAETFIVPYLIYKHTGKYVRSLADHGLFKGKLGDYLHDLGVMSTREAGRHEAVIGDLMCGRHDWMIYPEGAMMKSKKIFKRGRFVMVTPHRIGPPHTGGAMLALKAEIIRRQLRDACDAGDDARTTAICDEFDISPDAALSAAPIRIVPVTISYYPLRPGQNLIKKLVTRFASEIPPRLAEELEIEGNLLLHRTDINVHFGEPIAVGDYLRSYYVLARLVPMWRSLERHNLLLKRQATKLTRSFMKRIYTNLEVNLDHLVCTGLRLCPDNPVSEAHFRRALCATAATLAGRGKYRLHQTLGPGVLDLAVGRPLPAYDDVFGLCRDSRIVTRDDDSLTVNRMHLNMMHMFHTVRVRNPAIVIANELEPLRGVTRVLKSHLAATPEALAGRLADGIASWDRRLYRDDRAASGCERGGRSDGAPYVLRGRQPQVGVVLSHGFLAAPEETRPLAEHLNECGCTVYGVRLRGHATTPEDLAATPWEAWLRSFLRGYAVLRQRCDEIVFGGFSTGGLISLLAAAECDGEHLVGTFAVNTPSRLRYVNARLAPAAQFCNTLFDLCNRSEAGVRYVDSQPENPAINYTRIPVAGLHQLGLMMDHCRARLDAVRCPVHLIHADADPVVAPRSSELVYARLGTERKRIEHVDFDRHVIVRGPGCESVFRSIHGFVSEHTRIGPPAVDTGIHQAVRREAEPLLMPEPV
jgi:esterase/lipase